MPSIQLDWKWISAFKSGFRFDKIPRSQVPSLWSIHLSILIQSLKEEERKREREQERNEIKKKGGGNGEKKGIKKQERGGNTMALSRHVTF